MKTESTVYIIHESISCLPNMYNTFCLVERGQISGILEMVTNAGQLTPAELGQDEEDEDENKAEESLHEYDEEYKPDEPPPKKMKIGYTNEERESLKLFFSNGI